MGYFPTYTLGNLNASQLFAAALRDRPVLSEELAKGNYSTLTTWLRERIHQQGERYRPRDLMRFATGAPTEASHHVRHLRERFVGV